MFSILISSTGLSPFSVLAFSMLRTTSAPFATRPNTVCLLSSHGVGTVVMKNCVEHAQHVSRCSRGAQLDGALGHTVSGSSAAQHLGTILHHPVTFSAPGIRLFQAQHSPC